MNFQALFTLTNIVVAPFWLLMIAAPTWRVTKQIVRLRWIVLPIALTYAIPILPNLLTDLPVLARPNYEAVHQLLQLPRGTALAWAHILSADLFVGRWIYLDSRSKNLNPILMAPIMILSLLAGPLGFTLYLILNAATAKSHPEAEPVVV